MSAVDPNPLAASGNLRRRRRTDRFMRGLSTGAAVIAVAILVIVLVTVAEKGASQLSLSFLFKDPQTSLNGLTGGIANSLAGTGLIVALATVMALPIGVLVAVYLTEFSTPRTARPVRLVLDLLNGMPSIVIGVFVYGLVVAGHGEVGWAGSLGLAIIMVPLIARAAGETAPLLLTTAIFSDSTTVNIFGTPIPNIPVTIFQLSESAAPSDHARAWGAALVLIVLILIGNLSARAMLERQRRKLQAR